MRFPATVFICLFGTYLSAQNNSQVRYYYAVEDLDKGGVVQRGVTSKDGFPAGGLILGPNTHYRFWSVKSETLQVGFQEFTTPNSGQTFHIPTIRYGLPLSPDSDRDGLSDDAEFVVGTDPLNPDTNGDGINDGAAARLGIDADSSRTGIIGTASTPGAAVDVCAANNIVAVADSANGVSIFNVFNRMNPLLIAQVPINGSVTAVAISGYYLVVAAGSGGVAVLDIAHPPDVPLVFQASVGGTVQAVAASGDYAFVGTVEGTVTMIELSSGTGLQTMNLGGRVEDLAIEGSTLYAYANGELQVIPITQRALAVAGFAVSPALGGFSFVTGRGRLFVGGGIAYLVHRSGYNAFVVTNTVLPLPLLQNNTSQRGWKQLALDGSGLMVATVSPNLTTDGPHNLWRYSLANPAVPAVFQTEFVTPGIATSVCIYNGLAYVADNAAGLQVIRFKETDFLRQAPSGLLTCSVSSGTNGAVVEGIQVFFQAAVADDVQVRNVEFYVDGQKQATDGNFPFEFAWRAPAGAVGRTFAFTAVVSDTGGNTTNLNAIELTVTPDTQPPTLVIDSPTPTQVLFEGDDITVRLTAFDNIGIASLSFTLDGQAAAARRLNLTDWVISAALPHGVHTLSAIAVDYSGLFTTAGPIAITLRREVNSREITVLNAGVAPVFEAVSGEITVLGSGGQPRVEAIGREVTLSNLGAVRSGYEAISREVTLLNPSPQTTSEAISRNVTMLNLGVEPLFEAISREITLRTH